MLDQRLTPFSNVEPTLCQCIHQSRFICVTLTLLACYFFSPTRHKHLTVNPFSSTPNENSVQNCVMCRFMFLLDFQYPFMFVLDFQCPFTVLLDFQCPFMFYLEFQ